MSKAKEDYIDSLDRAQSREDCREGLRDSRWGPQVLLDKVGAFELWETIPKRNAYGGVRREVGEAFSLGGVTYTVAQVSPTGALCKPTAPRVVQYTDGQGREAEKKVWVSGTITVGLYRQESDGV